MDLYRRVLLTVRILPRVYSEGTVSSVCSREPHVLSRPSWDESVYGYERDSIRLPEALSGPNKNFNKGLSLFSPLS